MSEGMKPPEPINRPLDSGDVLVDVLEGIKDTIVAFNRDLGRLERRTKALEKRVSDHCETMNAHEV